MTSQMFEIASFDKWTAYYKHDFYSLSNLFNQWVHKIKLIKNALKEDISLNKKSNNQNIESLKHTLQFIHKCSDFEELKQIAETLMNKSTALRKILNIEETDAGLKPYLLKQKLIYVVEQIILQTATNQTFQNKDLIERLKIHLTEINYFWNHYSIRYERWFSIHNDLKLKRLQLFKNEPGMIHFHIQKYFNSMEYDLQPVVESDLSSTVNDNSFCQLFKISTNETPSLPMIPTIMQPHQRFLAELLAFHPVNSIGIMNMHVDQVEQRETTVFNILQHIRKVVFDSKQPCDIMIFISRKASLNQWKESIKKSLEMYPPCLHTREWIEYALSSNKISKNFTSKCTVDAFFGNTYVLQFDTPSFPMFRVIIHPLHCMLNKTLREYLEPTWNIEHQQTTFIQQFVIEQQMKTLNNSPVYAKYRERFSTNFHKYQQHFHELLSNSFSKRRLALPPTKMNPLIIIDDAFYLTNQNTIGRDVKPTYMFTLWSILFQYRSYVSSSCKLLLLNSIPSIQQQSSHEEDLATLDLFKLLMLCSAPIKSNFNNNWPTFVWSPSVLKLKENNEIKQIYSQVRNIETKFLDPFLFNPKTNQFRSTSIEQEFIHRFGSIISYVNSKFVFQPQNYDEYYRHHQTIECQMSSKEYQHYMRTYHTYITETDKTPSDKQLFLLYTHPQSRMSVQRCQWNIARKLETMFHHISKCEIDDGHFLVSYTRIPKYCRERLIEFCENELRNVCFVIDMNILLSTCCKLETKTKMTIDMLKLYMIEKITTHFKYVIIIFDTGLLKEKQLIETTLRSNEISITYQELLQLQIELFQNGRNHLPKKNDVRWLFYSELKHLDRVHLSNVNKIHELDVPCSISMRQHIINKVLYRCSFQFKNEQHMLTYVNVFENDNLMTNEQWMMRQLLTSNKEYKSNFLSKIRNAAVDCRLYQTYNNQYENIYDKQQCVNNLNHQNIDTSSNIMIELKNKKLTIANRFDIFLHTSADDEDQYHYYLRAKHFQWNEPFTIAMFMILYDNNNKNTNTNNNNINNIALLEELIFSPDELMFRCTNDDHLFQILQNELTSADKYMLKYSFYPILEQYQMTIEKSQYISIGQMFIEQQKYSQWLLKFKHLFSDKLSQLPNEIDPANTLGLNNQLIHDEPLSIYDSKLSFDSVDIS